MRVYTLLLTYLRQFGWLLLRSVFVLAQRCVWMVTGTARQLRDSRRPANYSRSAHVLHIASRFKFDAYLGPASQRDFIATHVGFVHPEYVLADHVTLYQLDDHEAVFIEAVVGAKLWLASCSPFIMTAQYQRGVRLVVMPTTSLHRLVDERLPEPAARGRRLVFLTNTARCGSTLLTQMFEETGHVVAVSEPSALNVLAQVAERGRSAAIERLIISAVRTLCKPTAAGNELAYVIKLTAPAMQRLAIVMQLFPSSKALFMYRDGLKVAQSLYRLSEVLPALKTVFVVGKGSKTRLGWCMLAMGMPSDAFRFELHHELSFGAVLWVASIQKYLEFRAAGLDVAAVLYEDLVADPEASMARILRFLALPEEMAAMARRALEWDSQQNTALANSVLRRHATLEYTSGAKVECDLICDRMSLPRFGNEYIAPETITRADKTMK